MGSDSKRIMEKRSLAAAQGFCIFCLTTPATPDFKSCEKCRAANTAQAKARYQKMKMERNCRGACGRTAPPRKQYCDECRDKPRPPAGKKERNSLDSPQCLAFFDALTLRLTGRR